jgi:hypothetical protein
MRRSSLRSQEPKQSQKTSAEKKSKAVHWKTFSKDLQLNEIEENDLFSGFSKFKTTKGSPMIKIGGYEYIRDYEVNEKVYWKCRYKCDGRAISIGYDQQPFYIREHDCSCKRTCQQDECSDYSEVDDIQLNTEHQNSEKLSFFPDKKTILSIFFFLFMYFYDNICYGNNMDE